LRQLSFDHFDSFLASLNIWIEIGIAEEVCLVTMFQCGGMQRMDEEMDGGLEAREINGSEELDVAWSKQ